uniref:PHD-type domain-containing protein n=1 Tax=Arcella intermedia TaxID=1963864 RepID=A0A6B2LGM4_9EUKA
MLVVNANYLKENDIEQLNPEHCVGVVIPHPPREQRKENPPPTAGFRPALEPPPSTFARPSSYIRHQDWTPDQIDESGRVEYELDSEDERWLESYNKGKAVPLQEDDFEFVIDKLEKEAFLKGDQLTLLNTNPDNILEESDCVVCLEGLSEDSNQIVFCDGCDLAVHQYCYGLRVIPEGEWNCRACSQLGIGQAAFQKCSLCHEKGGAMKEISSSEWVHIQCALFILLGD